MVKEKEEPPIWMERPLDPEELRQIRILFQEWERYKWFWRIIRQIAYWIGGVIGGVWVMRDQIAIFIQKLAS